MSNESQQVTRYALLSAIPDPNKLSNWSEFQHGYVVQLFTQGAR